MALTWLVLNGRWSINAKVPVSRLCRGVKIDRIWTSLKALSTTNASEYRFSENVRSLKPHCMNPRIETTQQHSWRKEGGCVMQAFNLKYGYSQQVYKLLPLNNIKQHVQPSLFEARCGFKPTAVAAWNLIMPVLVSIHLSLKLILQNHWYPFYKPTYCILVELKTRLLNIVNLTLFLCTAVHSQCCF